MSDQALTRLDAIDRKAEPRAWLEEVERIRAERKLRFECIRIAEHIEPLHREKAARELIDWLQVPAPRFGQIRLECIRACHQPETISISGLIAQAERLLTFVTEGDNG